MFFYSHKNLCSKLQGGRILMRPPCYKSQNKFITKRKYSTCTDGITQHAERAEALSPGQRPGLLCLQTCRPVRAKALLIAAIFKAFALTGRLADCLYTQGVALG